ncbi:bax inhibitor 1 [Prunus yedoensis var. nudiflora]|uniref:Bax inhibitor 1 n=1 Tax=Prunus yedoensis var. nudiflora TaxID=2094558 RepID=A0A314V180_PRUYE|nr:bax inhibitor 1 [Prunus yedoensis var. nudiflora]
MDAFTSFLDSQTSSRNRWNFESLKNFRQISPVVQNHLKLVYLTLCCTLIASAAGAYLHILWNIGGIVTLLGCVGCMIWVLATPHYEEKKRVSLLMAAGLLEGATLGPLIHLAIEINPSSSHVGKAQRIPLPGGLAFFWTVHATLVAICFFYLWGFSSYV